MVLPFVFLVFLDTLHLFHCLLQVGDNVVAVLNTDTESDEVGTYTGFEQLLVAELTMGV